MFVCVKVRAGPTEASGRASSRQQLISVEVFDENGEVPFFFSDSYIIKESSPTCKFSQGMDGIQDSYSVFKKIPDRLSCLEFVFVCPGLSQSCSLRSQ